MEDEGINNTITPPRGTKLPPKVHGDRFVTENQGLAVGQERFFKGRTLPVTTHSARKQQEISDREVKAEDKKRAEMAQASK